MFRRYLIEVRFSPNWSSPSYLLPWYCSIDFAIGTTLAIPQTLNRLVLPVVNIHVEPQPKSFTRLDFVADISQEPHFAESPFWTKQLAAEREAGKFPALDWSIAIREKGFYTT